MKPQSHTTHLHTTYDNCYNRHILELDMGSIDIDEDRYGVIVYVPGHGDEDEERCIRIRHYPTGIYTTARFITIDDIMAAKSFDRDLFVTLITMLEMDVENALRACLNR